MVKHFFLILLILLASLQVADAQGLSQNAGPTIQLQDEGTNQGQVNKLNCVGSAVACTRSGVTGTITITSGGGSFAETEIDFGATPTAYANFTVSNGSVTASSKILVSQSGNAPTGKSADENEMDRLTCSALPASGSFTLYCKSEDGPVVGTYKVFYVFG